MLAAIAQVNRELEKYTEVLHHRDKYRLWTNGRFICLDDGVTVAARVWPAGTSRAQITVDLLNDYPPTLLSGEFHLGLPDRIAAGVYQVWDSAGNCLYVGQSRNISKRLADPKHHTRKEKAVFVTWIEEWDPCERTYRECLLIGLLRPSLNLRTPDQPYQNKED